MAWHTHQNNGAKSSNGSVKVHGAAAECTVTLEAGQQAQKLIVGITHGTGHTHTTHCRLLGSPVSPGVPSPTQVVRHGTLPTAGMVVLSLSFPQLRWVPHILCLSKAMFGSPSGLRWRSSSTLLARLPSPRQQQCSAWHRRGMSSPCSPLPGWQNLPVYRKVACLPLPPPPEQRREEGAVHALATQACRINKVVWC